MGNIVAERKMPELVPYPSLDSAKFWPNYVRLHISLVTLRVHAAQTEKIGDLARTVVPISVMQCWLGGVVDTGFPIPSHAETLPRELAPAATGILTVIGSFQVDRVIEAFKMVTVERQVLEGNQVEAVATRFALAQPYRLDLVRQSMMLRWAGEAGEPVRIARIEHCEFGQISIVTKGVHRTYAARQFGLSQVDGIAEEIWRIDPSAFCIVGRHLVRRPSVGHAALTPQNVEEGPTLAIDICHLLAFFGTQILPSTKPDPQRH